MKSRNRILLAFLPLVIAVPASARPLLGDEELAYLASPGFQTLLLAQSTPPAGALAGCREQIRLLAIDPLETISMEGAVHPRHGLWVARFEREACGRLVEHRLLLSARAGEAPLARDWPR